MERNLSHVLKCPDEAPTSEEILYNMDPSTCFMYSVLTLMTLVGSLVYLEETVYITRKITPSCKKTAYIWVTGAPPVIAATSYVGLWVPRSSMFTDFTASIYLSICLHKFLVMMLEEFGGEETLVRRLQGKPLKTSTGPCCCCCLCLPPLHVSRTSLTILKWGTLQAALLRPTLMFFATVLWSNGTYQQDGGEGGVPMDHFAVRGCFPALAVAHRNCVCPGPVRALKAQHCSEVCPEPDGITAAVMRGIQVLAKERDRGDWSTPDRNVLKRLLIDLVQ
ncbi:organic solute transporter subunit alpha-like isoform X4 [Brienomyrus brachyistius]|uniref:organic solute transporter subunit alpha-like isoform X4 n=1 Tax=Brienomyrus brachyistius TaxID=42636 RepID=UPI0020B3046E|nr:organic solute transporter subunit alpha-like isoform X4 [Brienomyrus brachyistius]